MSQVPKETTAGLSDWQSYHLFYHDDLNVLLLRCVRPLVVHLQRLGWARKFFFIRYQLGGPHVRLRVLPEPGRELEVRAFINQKVSEFFQKHASLSTKSEALIRRANKVLLANDPHERGDEVFVNNSLLEVPFVPETERYGGPGLLPHSLDFFVFSSITVLSILEDYSVQKQSLRTATAARYLIRLGLGFSESLADLHDLLGYGMEWSMVHSPNFMLLVDKLHEQQKDVMRQLVQNELRTIIGANTQPAENARTAFWIRVAASFAARIAQAEADRRRHILHSHLHMTANRLDLKNTDEFYLSRLICRALDDLPPADRKLLDHYLSSRLQRDATGASGSLAAAQLLETAFGFLQNDSLPVAAANSADLVC